MSISLIECKLKCLKQQLNLGEKFQANHYLFSIHSICPMGLSVVAFSSVINGNARSCEHEQKQILIEKVSHRRHNDFS